MSRLTKFLLLLFTGLIFLSVPYSSFAQNSDRVGELEKKISETERKLSETRSKKNTLSSQIKYLTNQIYLTTLKITNTETKIGILEDSIEDLDDKIERLDSSLDSISSLLLERIVASYKYSAQARGAAFSPFYLLLSSNGFDELFRKSRQLSIVEEYDTNLLLAVESSKTGFEKQKELRENKQEQLSLLKDKYNNQKQVLGSQTAAKNQLLEVTKNDEKRYQELLAAARAELDAIQAIVAGKGEEEEIGKVNEGDKIASIIPGSSYCSSGGHLHFEVAENGINHNPASYLQSKDVKWNNGPDSSFSFSGSWQWPINDVVRITQGYGMTYYAAQLNYYRGGPHTGIDMTNKSDYTVKAVKSGTLYKGGIKCGGGILEYVKVVHDDSNLESYYLHVR